MVAEVRALRCGEMMTPEMRDDVLRQVAGDHDLLCRLATDIWEHPETGFSEVRAAALLASTLEREGFQIKRAVAGIETAFVAEWGTGGPVVGVLGEYDALPGLSQKVSATRDPVVPGAPGHACGHNLLGVGGLGAVLAARRVMESTSLPGTIRYYGCPAEETLMGKVYMAREGLFDDLDAALTWHPMYPNTLWSASSVALNSFKLSFRGVSAHAGAAPEAGRSALDAVMLTDVGVNYLREHVPSTVRIHCVVTHGGEAPNIVPAFAQSWYFVRAPDRAQVGDVYERVLKVARGAAMMTDTTLEVEPVAACYDYRPNRAVERVLLENMKQAGPPVFTPSELEFAGELAQTLPAGMVDDAARTLGGRREDFDILCSNVCDSLNGLASGQVHSGSTDVGDVSYIVPTAQMAACCIPLGVALHSWQAVASCGSSIGLKGMLFVSRSLGLTIVDLLGLPDTLAAAREELVRYTGGRRYECPLAADARPHAAPGGEAQ
jgi:aminobenzoyl-glutamate utilization protein B